MLLGRESASCSAATNPCLQRCWLGTGVPCHEKGCEPEKRKWGLERLVLCLLAFLFFSKNLMCYNKFFQNLFIFDVYVYGMHVQVPTQKRVSDSLKLEL